MADLDQEQRVRINKVLEYIENNLDQTLTLNTLAKMSTYSPSHFHRLFTEGVPRNNPYITPSDKCRYDCCIAVPSGTPVGNEVDSLVQIKPKLATLDLDCRITAITLPIEPK